MVYVDTNILIYLLENHPKFGVLAADELTALHNGGNEFISSVITVTEFLAGTKGSDIGMLDNIAHLAFVDATKEIAQKAAMLQRQTNMNIGDALHLSTALTHKAKLLLTNDHQLAKAAKKYIPLKTLG